MPITAECPVCGHKGPVPDTFKGKKVKCHECHNMFTIGGETAAAGARPAAKQKSNPDMSGSGMDLAGANGVGPAAAASDPFNFDNPAPAPQPTRKSAPGTVKKPPQARDGIAGRPMANRPRPLRKRNQEPLPMGALIMGGLATVLGLAAIIVANKGLIGLASVPVGGFGLLLAIGGVVTAMGRGWPILVPIVGLLVCLGALPIGGYQTYQLIASGALSSADEHAKKTSTESEPKREGPTGQENRIPPTQPQPRQPPPPPPSNPDEWADAHQGFRLGKVVVRVAGIETDVLRSKDGREISKDKHALIRLDIQNVSPGDVDYFSWATSPPQGNDPLPQLTDNNGTAVKWAQPDGSVLVNQVNKAEPIPAGRTVSDVLAFVIPADTTEYLRLELVGGNVGETGKFRLQMPKGMLLAFAKGSTPDGDPVVPKGGDPQKMAKFVQEQLAMLPKAKSEAEKVNVITLLGLCGKDAAPAAGELARYLKGQPGGVRAAAADALGKMGAGARGQVAALQAALKDEFWKVQANAARALGNIGPDAKVAIPDLLPLLNSKEEEVPQSAREAIRRLDPSKLPKK